MTNNNQTETTAKTLACISRRQFLLNGGITVAVLSLGTLPGTAWADSKFSAKMANYPRCKIARISDLNTGQPVTVRYPYRNVPCILVKMGVPGGGGVGQEKDIVCFTNSCTHMGGPLQGTYKPEHQILGACPLHLTTYDLTRHGMVISGHGTESLPQIVLETERQEIYATGVMGLIYGYDSNLDRKKQ